MFHRESGLHRETWGSGSPVVLVHGFTQTAGSWGAVGSALAPLHRLVGIDAPGHGGSGDIRADLESGADLMAEAAPEPAAWMGYSMGGRYCLHVALQRPDTVTRLVLVSATGGIDSPEERGQRRAGDDALARRIESDGVEPFLRDWLAQPLFAGLAPDGAEMDSRLGNTPAGLASSLRLAGAGTQNPLWERVAALEMPVLIVAGEHDTKYVALGERLLGAIGANAGMSVIPGAGHACHLEKPDDFLAQVIPFLDDRP